MADHHAAFACPACQIAEVSTCTNPLIGEIAIDRRLSVEKRSLKRPTRPGFCLGVNLEAAAVEKFSRYGVEAFPQSTMSNFFVLERCVHER
jgi:hypothetical protein